MPAGTQPSAVQHPRELFHGRQLRFGDGAFKKSGTRGQARDRPRSHVTRRHARAITCGGGAENAYTPAVFNSICAYRIRIFPFPHLHCCGVSEVGRRRGPRRRLVPRTHGAARAREPDEGLALAASPRAAEGLPPRGKGRRPRRGRRAVGRRLAVLQQGAEVDQAGRARPGPRMGDRREAREVGAVASGVGILQRRKRERVKSVKQGKNNMLSLREPNTRQ